MGKKNKTISCPYCGNQVIKEAFYDNGTCGHPECGFDISDQSDVIKYFESIQRKEDYSDIFGESYTMKRTRNSDREELNRAQGETGEEEIDNFSISAPEELDDAIQEEESADEADDVQPAPTEDVKEKKYEEVPSSEISAVAESKNKEESRQQEALEKLRLIREQQRKERENKSANVTSESTAPVNATRTSAKIDVESANVQPPIEASNELSLAPEEESTPSSTITEIPSVEEKPGKESDEIARLRAELAEKQKEIEELERRKHENAGTSASGEPTVGTAPTLSSEPEVNTSVENEKHPEETGKPKLSVAELIRVKKPDDTNALGTNEKLEKMNSPYNSNEDGYYDDTKSLVPPQPDIIDKKAILRVVLTLVGLAGLTLFLIMWA